MTQSHSKIDEQNTARLQKYLARCGVASRRHSEKMISEGRVSVNGKIVTKLGTKIMPEVDIIEVDGKKIEPSLNDITLALNKPAGYVCTMNDPQGRPCVAELVPVDKYPSLFPVGRLDRLTSGLLIFTTDGELGQKLLHPKHEVGKQYEVIIDGKLNEGSQAYNQLTSGVKILSGMTSPAKVTVLEHFDFQKYLQYENEFFKGCARITDADSLPSEKDLINKIFTKVLIEIHEGKNRQVRRMFSAVGYEVLLLTRISVGNLKLDGLETGKWRKIH